MTKKLIALASALTVLASPALAHPGHVGDPTGLHGHVHGFTMLDGLVGLIVIGIIALFFLSAWRSSASDKRSKRFRP